ncbi:dynamin family protein [Paenisporosarcina sp.]|uniref:dynamin family protein n=1 Tax=Paenisporosarcina sp. TaxID=1932001 RepID=UPI003C72ECDD
MINKQFAYEQYNYLKNMTEEFYMPVELNEKLVNLKKTIDQFSMKILTIGAFSAGKSALLNHLLEEDLLVEEQTPETAIATELNFGAIESFEIVNLENKRSRVEKNQLKSVEPNTAMNIRYIMNNDFLYRFKEYTFVDMPGFNSNLQHHNKAIFQYIGQGNAYLLVLDCEDGGIKASALDFIEEIRQYEHNLIIVITKSDKKTPTEITQIKNNVINQASYLFDTDVPVVTYSKYDEESREQLADAIKKINAQYIFEQATMPLIDEIYTYLKMAIQQIVKSLSFDEATFKEEIFKRQKAKNDLEYKLKIERTKLTNRMSSQVLPNIMNSVETALYTNSTELANAAILGTHAFSSRVNSLLRPVLMESTKRYTEESYDEFLKEINLDDILTDKTDEIVQGVTDKIRQVSDIMANSAKTSETFNKTYKAVTGILAIATTAVAPWLELIILFLPEILKIIGVGGKESQIAKVKSSIEAEVIPQIIVKLRPAIQESLVEIEAQLIEELEVNMKLMMSIEEEALLVAQQKQNTAGEEHNGLVKQYHSSLSFIETQLQSIKSITRGMTSEVY